MMKCEILPHKYPEDTRNDRNNLDWQAFASHRLKGHRETG
jgi:hypothetical protein